MNVNQIERQVELNAEEADKLHCFQNRIDVNMKQRFRFLRHRLEQEQLTPDEHQELMSLIDTAENINVARMEFLIEVAHSRGMTLADIIHNLTIGPLLS